MQVFRFDLRISCQHLPVAVSRYKRDLFNAIALFEKAGNPLVAEVMKPKVVDAKRKASSWEESADGAIRYGEYPLIDPRLANGYVEGITE